MSFQRVCILGSTGSIGCSTLDVIARHSQTMAVYALSAYSRMEKLAEQALQYQVQVVVVPDGDAATQFIQAYGKGSLPEIRIGEPGLIETASDSAVDTVMAAIVGAACLAPVLAAARAGKRILLANKEALVAAGGLFMDAVRQGNASLIPIDSEHNAIFQCLPEASRHHIISEAPKSIRRLLLTASGGPFRTLDLNDLASVTPEQACAHPNWSMGKKISVDSATMLNKGLEVIEAHWLFAMPADKIDVVIHPQSLIHSMVEYIDGSVLAQLGQPDMRTSIAYGLGFPERIESGVGLLGLTAMGRLDFEEPDFERFPCLKLSFEALATSQAACITLNAANEVAVDLFLKRKISYNDIPRVISNSIERVVGMNTPALDCLESVLGVDHESRIIARGLCSSAA
ncbi:1-deoxy-D-xylulose-5-phosphate reductoisomerase [Paenalcaligenes niemegkensis]|uniref:1-deoxy-D-xylulose-5-phosphate reductoisomerase n=1 Tax=Paenalcaligenes niemegkensis TaxID=2895469 RepID=UPI001EE963CA|nr:1-deoxy-D-xylulose-5-phosphate reductoisomerase [Paenalcaligenes niemegkensis]MCQ9616289.1 1-deoxy-D-xylulose-5-phosphate reductoisomerase [Paenalcaligenes niemegkensis]